MARVLFVSTNFNDSYILPTAPGLFTAILKQNGHDIHIFDTTHYAELSDSNFNETRESKATYRKFDSGKLDALAIQRKSAKEDLNDLINKISPNVIMISLTEALYKQVVCILDYIKTHKIFTVVGGVFPTFAPDIFLNMHSVNAVCVGEGEKAILDICNCIDKGIECKDVENTFIKVNGAVIRNIANTTSDINENPVPDFSLFEESRFYRPMAGKLYKMLPIETSRGCPYHCTFCNSPAQAEFYKQNSNQKYFRKKTVKKIQEELTCFVKNYNPEYFYFLSDTFLTFTNKEFDEFIEIYSDIKLPFWIQTRAETVIEDKIKRLKDVGLHRMSLGIEHGNEKFRKKVLKKGVSNETIIKALEIIHSVELPAGITVNNMVGFPTETPELAMDTVEFNHKIAKFVDSMNSSIFIPFKGTSLRKLAVDSGYMNDGVIASESIEGESLLNMPQFPKERIKGISKVFSLYARFDKSRWSEIKIAEEDSAIGREMFEKLMKEFKKTYL